MKLACKDVFGFGDCISACLIINNNNNNNNNVFGIAVAVAKNYF